MVVLRGAVVDNDLGGQQTQMLKRTARGQLPDASKRRRLVTVLQHMDQRGTDAGKSFGRRLLGVVIVLT
jgi:hypothetical protein